MALIPWEFLAATVGAVVALVAAWISGKRSASVRAKNRGMRAEDAKHERINNADLGLGASDAERIKRLHDFANKHGN
jgi:uncharacterized membrane protein YccC